MRRKAAYLTCLFLVFGFGPVAFAEDDESGWKSKVRLSGFIKSYFQAIDPAQIDRNPFSEDEPLEGQVENKLRLQLSADPLSWLNMELAYEALPIIKGDIESVSPTFVSGPDASPYRVADFTTDILPKHGEPEGSFILSQNLDRAMVTIDTSRLTVFLGRQPISFGAARVINPLDIIAPFTFNRLDTEHRFGVDAVRAKTPIGDMGELDVGAVFAEDFRSKDSAAFVRTNFPAGKNQITLMTVGFKENLMAGADLSRSLGGAGFWMEAAYTWAKTFGDPLASEDFFRASTGMDYNINYKSGVYLYLEYHYNGAGTNDVGEYFTQALETAYRDAGVYLLGRHYFAPGGSYQITPLLTVSGGLLMNVMDESLYVSPKLEYNYSENVYLEAGANMAVGENARLGFFTIDPKSEFGLYPSFYFTSIRLYF